MNPLSLSPTRRALRKLKRNRVAMAALIVLIILYAGALFAPFIAPYHYDSDDDKYANTPPTDIRFFDADGRFHWRPFVFALPTEDDDQTPEVAHEPQMFPLKIFCRGAGEDDSYRFFGLFRMNFHLFGVDAPARVYIFGADEKGRDLFSRIVFGARFSLSIGIIGSIIVFCLGMLIGGISGYVGGRADSIIMRVCEGFMLAPAFYFMLTLRAVLPPTLPSWQVYILIVVIISFVSWAGFARVIRGMVLSITRQEYVIAARAVGARHLSIIVRHVLPNTLSYAIVSITVSIPGYILGETALSFIGLGIQDPYASWGNLLSIALSKFVSSVVFHPWRLIPGLFIIVTIMAFNFLGDGLRDAFDPRSITQASDDVTHETDEESDDAPA